MNIGFYLIIAGMATGIVTFIQPKFFWNNHKLARQFLGDKGTIAVHLIASAAMIIVGLYLLMKN